MEIVDCISFSMDPESYLVGVNCMNYKSASKYYEEVQTIDKINDFVKKAFICLFSPFLTYLAYTLSSANLIITVCCSLVGFNITYNWFHNLVHSKAKSEQDIVLDKMKQIVANRKKIHENRVFCVKVRSSLNNKTFIGKSIYWIKGFLPKTEAKRYYQARKNCRWIPKKDVQSFMDALRLDIWKRKKIINNFQHP